MLNIENLTYIHEGAHSGKDINKSAEPFVYNLSVDKIHVLTGKNGSGKSTLMDLIAGFLKPHEGDVKLQRKSLLGFPIKKRPVSYMMQDLTFFPQLSVLETLHLSGASKEECGKALEGFDISFEVTQKMETLSGGQRQLVVFLQALLQYRDIVLLDEPFSALDAATETQARFYLERHQNKTGCVVLMSHHA